MLIWHSETYHSGDPTSALVKFHTVASKKSKAENWVFWSCGDLAVILWLKTELNNKELDTKNELILTKWNGKRGQEISFQNKNSL